MSVLTQFTSSPVPFGQLLQLWDTRDNPTVDGVEYLKAGVLKSSTNYSKLVTDFPRLSVNAPTGNSYTFTNASSTVYRNAYLSNSSGYFAFSRTRTSVLFNANLTSNWGTGVSGITTTQTDACRFGSSNILLYIPTATNAIGYISGTGTGTVASLNPFTSCASNSAGTLAVMVASLATSAGAIYTSTNGLTWTSRTPSGGVSDAAVRTTWCPVGNCFIYVIQSNGVWTTTDGYTLTSRGSLLVDGVSIGNVGGSTANEFQGNFCASSASSTLISFNRYIIKTTDGINFSAILSPSGSSTPLVLKYFNSAYYAFSAQSGVKEPGQQVWKSTDEGVTWTEVPNIIIPSAVSPTAYLDQMASLNSNIIAFYGDTAISTGSYAVLSSFDTANYVGVPNATISPVGSGTDLNNPNTYVRIK